MLNNCKNCAKQYFCKLVNNSSNTSQECNFKSFIYTKNYGEVKYVKNKS